MRARRWTRVGRRSRGARRETYTTHENAFARVVDIDSTATRRNDPTVGVRAGARVSRMNECTRIQSTRDASAARGSRDEYRTHKKYTHPFASSFSSSPIAKDALSDGFHHSHAFASSRVSSLERGYDRDDRSDVGTETTARDEAAFATRGDAPGDGGGRELRGRGHGWRETSTSADADDDDDDEDEADEDDRPTDRATDRRAVARGWPGRRWFH